MLRLRRSSPTRQADSHVANVSEPAKGGKSRSFVSFQKISLKVNRKYGGLFLVMMSPVIWFVLFPLRYGILGYRTMGGGMLGRGIDSLTRTLIYRKTIHERNAKLQAMGIQLPPLQDEINKRGIPTQPQAALVEILLRSFTRNIQLDQAKELGKEWKNQCRFNNSTSSVPRQILQPDCGSFFRPLRGYSDDDLITIHFDHSAMRRVVEEKIPSLLSYFDRSMDKEEQVMLWSLIALYSYGGFVFGPSTRDVAPLVTEVVQANHGCAEIGIILLESRSDVNDEPRIQIKMMAATPRHPCVLCLLKNLEQRSTLTQLQWGPEIFLLGKIQGRVEPEWDVLTTSTPCMTEKEGCCRELRRDSSPILAIDQTKSEGFATLFVKVLHDDKKLPKNLPGQSESLQRHRVETLISERIGTAPPEKRRKAPIYQRLDSIGCEAGWICNRCLKSALYGTYESCRYACRSCYENIICNDPNVPRRRVITIDVRVKERRPKSPQERKIPRIIHQTWYDEPTVDRFPQLSRLQNSWKNTGWEYRFYTDETARQFIAQNYPARVLDAFNSLVPGAFKADLFRYLVLLKDGGVYVDLDILLDTNLDSFITPNMSFFVPRDIVGDYAAQNFCLWNGLIGAVPGHPFLVRAVEKLLTNILNRVDYHDMERDLCLATGATTQVWKARALSILLLSGPCLLGIAVNEALGRDPVSKYEPGWLAVNEDSPTMHRSNASDTGDTLLLIASRADMGALRFTDVSRNIMVASTNLKDLSKDSIPTIEELKDSSEEPKGEHIHYSLFEHASDIFGAAQVYSDDLVNNEIIKLSVTRVNIS